jgi:hypothetical protein
LLTKNQAREIVESAGVVEEDLELRLIDLPKHRIASVLAAVEDSAKYLEPPA